MPFIRTFDLPDIHFEEFTGLEEDGARFIGIRTADADSVESIALSRWSKQSAASRDDLTRRDCWVQADGSVYIAWGAYLALQSVVDASGRSMETWEFKADELKQYDPVEAS